MRRSISGRRSTRRSRGGRWLLAQLPAGALPPRLRGAGELNRPTFELFEDLRQAGVETTLRTPGLVHAFLSLDEARHHLELQRAMAGTADEVPDGVRLATTCAGSMPRSGPG